LCLHGVAALSAFLCTEPVECAYQSKDRHCIKMGFSNSEGGKVNWKEVGKKALKWVVVPLLDCFLVVIIFLLPWSGFSGKTFWDLMDLLIIPIMLTFGALLFSQAQRKAEVEVELDRQREATLQAYFDQMTELLEKGLRKSEPGAEIRTIARARTRTALRQLDGGRKGALLQFLYEAELIGSVGPIDDASRQLPIIHIGEAGDLKGLVLSRTTMWGIDLELADLNEANLRGLDLYGAVLRSVDLSGAILSEVALCKADLRAANLRNTIVSGRSAFPDAKLHNADLRGADLEGAHLRQAKYDSNTKWPKGFDPVSAGAILED
jgi:hypothetical protein